MKKIIKTNLKIIIAFTIGVIISTGVTGVAAYTLLSNHIEYNPADSAWKVNNVEDALDSLYIAKTGDNYSTEERVVGTWIDGRPIYQKTIYFGNLPNNSSKSVAHNITNIKTIINGIGYAQDANTFYPIPYTHADGLRYQVQLYLDRTNINIITKNDLSDFTYYITVQYTKTTDTSTNEQAG